MNYTIFCVTITTIIYLSVLVIPLNCVSVEKDLSLTLREKITLDKFRQKVRPVLRENYMKTDIYLIRWLRARNFNLDAAESLLKENIRWRKETNMDRILKENFDDMFQDYPATIDTVDKRGRPIAVIDVNEWDIRAVVLQGRAKRFLRYLDFLMESVTTQVFEQQARGLNVTQWKVLANCDGFNLVTHGCPICIPLWLQFLGGLETHFTGWMDELIAIDSPSAVHIIIEILKPALSRQTREALTVLPANRRKWMQYLDERVNRSERRQAYGGTKPPALYD